MQIFKVIRNKQQYENMDYDEYDSFVVACISVDAARSTHPSANKYSLYQYDSAKEAWVDSDGEHATYNGWPHDIENLVVERIGSANPETSGVICSSFNAG
ncbi:MAG TPA: hypothetical protein EYQ00_09825 [Dehalococcoidia bacterium]|nr:hypothetical protein [Dehalococcoidia bacterium]